MNAIRLSNRQARNHLTFLHFRSRSGTVADHVRALGSIQYDPLDVVGRNADLVLQGRIPGYTPNDLLDALYVRRELIDGYDKNLCVYPATDFPCFKRVRDIGSARFQTPEVRNVFARVLEQIGERGPLCSADFGFSEKVDWPWGPTNLSRAALESLWTKGTLIIHHKKGSRRYFDRIEKYLPASVLKAPDPHADDAAYDAWLLKRRIGAVGLLWNRASDAFFEIMSGIAAGRRTQAFRRLLADGEIVPVEVEGLSERLYMLKRDEPVLRESADARPDAVMRFIAPLDNLMWDRKLIEALFGFRYRWEVYTPREKREYGYYVLPVLFGNRFVARFEPEHYRGGSFVIKNWWWEPSVKVSAAMLTARKNALVRFCRYLGADGYRLPSE